LLGIALERIYAGEKATFRKRTWLKGWTTISFNAIINLLSNNYKICVGKSQKISLQNRYTTCQQL